MKNKITKEEYFTLIGLNTITKEFLEKIDTAVPIIAGIIGEERGTYGFDLSEDFVWDRSERVDSWLNRLGIEIAKKEEG